MSTQQLLWLTDVPEAHLQLLECSQTDRECPGGQSSCSEKTVYSTVYMTLYIHILVDGLCTCIWHHLQFGRIRDLKLVSSVKTPLYALVFPEALYSTLTLFRDLCHLLSINHQQICFVLQSARKHQWATLGGSITKLSAWESLPPEEVWH